MLVFTVGTACLRIFFPALKILTALFFKMAINSLTRQLVNFTPHKVFGLRRSLVSHSYETWREAVIIN